ncbi:hypothetical protein [Mastigocladopsis repens]|uniref:hypothetical protein n=1 Tax=Mastigocladopsis repens TaxID=221287 RepID=UPI0002FFFF84|nr:hypothetical protein [Mastigocladopsis repens]
MNFKSLSKNVRPSVETEATAQEQDFIMEELSDEAAAAVSGGKRRTTGSYVAYPGTDEWNETILAGSYVVGG